jgi:hypothetical protein
MQRGQRKTGETGTSCGSAGSGRALLKRALCRWDGLAAGARRGTPFTGFAGVSLASLHLRTHWSSRDFKQSG